MADEPALDDLRPLLGRPVQDRDGTRLGIVEAIFVDRDTQVPEWLGVAAAAGATGRHVVPLGRADTSGAAVIVPFSRAEVEASGVVDEDEISPGTERRLYDHYGIPASAERSSSLLPDEGATDAGTAPETLGATSEAPERVDLDETLPVSAPTAGRLRRWVDEQPAPTEETLVVPVEPVAADVPPVAAEPAVPDAATPAVEPSLVPPPPPRTYEPAPEWSAPPPERPRRTAGIVALAAVASMLALLLLRRRRWLPETGPRTVGAAWRGRRAVEQSAERARRRPFRARRAAEKAGRAAGGRGRAGVGLVRLIGRRGLTRARDAGLAVTGDEGDTATRGGRGPGSD